jgi:hypothetical protein
VATAPRAFPGTGSTEQVAAKKKKKKKKKADSGVKINSGSITSQLWERSKVAQVLCTS